MVVKPRRKPERTDERPTDLDCIRTTYPVVDIDVEYLDACWQLENTNTEFIFPLSLTSGEASVAHKAISSNLELRISHHFANKYFSLLILPSCHPEFHDGWLAEIQKLMTTHKSLYYSVLANAASHMYLVDGAWRLQNLALTYYADAVSELSKLLDRVPQLENHNGLLMSVMMLYLHGVGFCILHSYWLCSYHSVNLPSTVHKLGHRPRHPATRYRRNAYSDPPPPQPSQSNRQVIRQIGYRKRHVPDVHLHNRSVDGYQSRR